MFVGARPGTRRLALERRVGCAVSPVDGVSGVFVSEIDILEKTG